MGIKTGVIISLSVACGTLLLYAYGRLPAEYYDGRAIAYYWVALLLLPLLTLTVSDWIRKKVAWGKKLQKVLWALCWFVLFLIFIIKIEMPIPYEVWESTGAVRIPAVIITFSVGYIGCWGVDRGQ